MWPERARVRMGGAAAAAVGGRWVTVCRPVPLWGKTYFSASSGLIITFLPVGSWDFRARSTPVHRGANNPQASVQRPFSVWYNSLSHTAATLLE
jgi:hypothetical protein